jgi:hypothetical protein
MGGRGGDFGESAHQFRLMAIAGAGLLEMAIILGWIPDFTIFSGNAFGLFPIKITYSIFILLCSAIVIFWRGWGE